MLCQICCTFVCSRIQVQRGPTPLKIKQRYISKNNEKKDIFHGQFATKLLIYWLLQLIVNHCYGSVALSFGSGASYEKKYVTLLLFTTESESVYCFISYIVSYYIKWIKTSWKYGMMIRILLQKSRTTYFFSDAYETKQKGPNILWFPSIHFLISRDPDPQDRSKIYYWRGVHTWLIKQLRGVTRVAPRSRSKKSDRIRIFRKKDILIWKITITKLFHFDIY